MSKELAEEAGALASKAHTAEELTEAHQADQDTQACMAEIQTLNEIIEANKQNLSDIRDNISDLGNSLKNSELESREYIYYRYWQHDVKRPAHLGIRSKEYKLIYNYGDGLGKSGTNKQKTKPYWEFYDLINDPGENYNNINNEDYKKIINKLHKHLIIEKNKTKDFELEIPKLS